MFPFMAVDGGVRNSQWLLLCDNRQPGVATIRDSPSAIDLLAHPNAPLKHLLEITRAGSDFKTRTARAASTFPQAFERFLRLAPRRVDKALIAIRRIGNLAAPAYESTESERQKIIDAIFAEANELKQKLEGKSKQHEPFSF